MPIRCLVTHKTSLIKGCATKCGGGVSSVSWNSRDDVNHDVHKREKNETTLRYVCITVQSDTHRDTPRAKLITHTAREGKGLAR